MKRVSCLIYLGLVLVVPITTYAELTGEIILRLPGDGNYELHITTIENPLDSHKIFSQKEKFVGLSVQRNGNLLVTRLSEPGIPKDIILFDRSTSEVRNLTQGQFGGANVDFRISVKGDVVFSHLHSEPEKMGLFFISSDEIQKVKPKIVRLDQREMFSVNFSPDGEQVVYGDGDWMYIRNLRTKQVTRLDQGGYMPCFSPNGKQIAFIAKREIGQKEYILSIVSLVNPLKETHIALGERFIVGNLKWSPNGEYITYPTWDVFATNKSFTYAVPVDGGLPEKVFDQFNGKYVYFDWTYSHLPVHPADLMTTTWGELKVRRVRN